MYGHASLVMIGVIPESCLRVGAWCLSLPPISASPNLSPFAGQDVFGYFGSIMEGELQLGQLARLLWVVRGD